MANVRCLLSSIFYFKTRSPTWKNLELADLTRLADQRAPRILPLLPLQCWDCMGVASYMSRFPHGSWGSKLKSSYLCGKHFIDWDISPRPPVPTTVYFKNSNKIQCISGAHAIKGQHQETRLVTQILFSARSWILQTTLLLAPQCQRLAQCDLSETLWRWEAAGGDGIWSILFFLQFLLSCQWHTFTPMETTGPAFLSGTPTSQHPLLRKFTGLHALFSSFPKFLDPEC